MRPGPFDESNRRFLSPLSYETRADYLAYVRLCASGGGYDADPDRSRIDLSDPKLVAGYLNGKELGKWSDKEFNARRRASGGRTYSPVRRDITEEDKAMMTRNATFAVRKHPDAPAARDRFAEATRSASFQIQLGVREIRLLASQPWTDVDYLMPTEVGTLQKLIDKGLLVHAQGENPHLSEAGELLRRMLVLSRHIVEKGSPAAEADDPDVAEAKSRWGDL